MIASGAIAGLAGCDLTTRNKKKVFPDWHCWRGVLSDYNIVLPIRPLQHTAHSLLLLSVFPLSFSLVPLLLSFHSFSSLPLLYSMFLALFLHFVNLFRLRCFAHALVFVSPLLIVETQARLLIKESAKLPTTSTITLPVWIAEVTVAMN